MLRPQPGTTVLVVEDDADSLDAIAEILIEEGYTVAGACNGKAALEFLEQNPPPHLILLDLMMPVMNGWQFLERVRLCRDFDRIPIVLLSADTALAEKARELAVAGWLRKPLQLEVLLDVVERHVAGEVP